MVFRRATKFAVQQLAQRGGPQFKRYVKEEYGQIAAGIAGIGLSYLSGGDYFGEIRKNFGGDKPSNNRNPPFGYFDGSEQVNGPTNGTQYQTLRPAVYRNYRTRNKYKYKLSKCCCRVRQKPRYRGRRRF